jgi:phospholipase/carboxylesterase
MNENTNIVKIQDWVIRQRLPDGEGPHRLILLLHGWTGDENSMWIFTTRLSTNYLVLSPRGISKTPLGGYGWEENGGKGWSAALDFQKSIDSLLDLAGSINLPGVLTEEFDVMGFSQGAALAYAMLLQHPGRIRKLAGLSGFMPAGLGDEVAAENLDRKKLFVAHGRKDEMVPLEKARDVVRELKDAGAEVIYCEEDVGHKLSAGCFRAMDDYFSR